MTTEQRRKRILELKKELEKEFKSGSIDKRHYYKYLKQYDEELKNMNENMKDVTDKIRILIRESTCSADIETNDAKGKVPLIGMRYRKRKKKSKLTGIDITTNESLDSKKM